MEHLHLFGEEGEEGDDTDGMILSELAEECGCKVEDVSGARICDITSQIQDQAYHPSVSQWKDHRYDGTSFFIHFDEAKHQLWNALKDELEHIMDRVECATRNNEESASMNLKIFQVFFGPRSEVYSVVHRRLGLSVDEFHRFLAVYYSCAFFAGFSTLRMYQEGDR
jgi:hypothetical protein